MKNNFDGFINNTLPEFLQESSNPLILPVEKSNNELIHPVQDDKPPVEGKPRYIAKRNRRLRSKYRNIQVFDTKTNKWADGNTRYTKFKDANASIEKMNPSD